MSAIAGMFCIDARDPVCSKSLAELQDSLALLGPDAGASISLGNVGLVHCELRNTPEPAQPLRIGTSWMTWDGRLDNRTELLGLLAAQQSDNLCDAEVALMSYQRWGLEVFEKLVGDFALCICDLAAARVLLARDPMGVGQLFLRRDSKQYVWATTIEPLVMSAGRPFILNAHHIHKLFRGQPCLDSTCYEDIFSVPPGSVLALRPGSTPLRRVFWSLPSGSKIRYRSHEEYDQEFRDLLQRSVARRLRSDAPVVAELSGGLDSSTIVCVADGLTPPGSPLIQTISYFNSDEPSGDERPYIQTVERYRGKSGRHIGMAEFHRDVCPFAPVPIEIPFQATPGRFDHSLKWNGIIRMTLQDIGSRVLLSGVGGDEMMGAVPFGAPEIAEHLCSGHLIRSVKCLMAWSVSQQRPALANLGEVIDLLRVRWNPESLTQGSMPGPAWLLPREEEEHTTLMDFADWKHLSPHQLSYEWNRCVLAGQLTIGGTSLLGDTEVRFPFLDRSLFEFLASIPREQIAQPGKRRVLQRRALRGIVPDEVLDRKTKWFGLRAAHDLLRTDIARQFVEEGWLTSNVLFDMKQLRQAHGAVLAGNTGQALAIQMAIAVEQWLRIQVERGTITMPA